MKKVTSKISECVAMSSSCVEWQGQDIPCLGIKKGDCLTELMTVVVEKVCELAEPMDLSTISLQCIVDKLGFEEPTQKTLLNILQLLVDGECHLKDLIDAINDGNSEPPLVLDLGCLAVFDSFGNQLPYTEESVLQQIIVELCAQRSEIAELGGQIGNLQTQIDNLPEPYVEPTLNSCVYTNKPTSQALALLAGDYCDYKTAIGDAPSISAAVSMQHPDFQAYYSAFEGWITSPVTGADMWNNMQIVLGDLFLRTNANEICCQGSCEDIKVGFEVETNEDNTRITLIYTEVMGTSIPSGWVDEGSVLTITDTAKRERKYFNLNVGQNTESPELDISGFLVNDELMLCLEVRLRNTTTDELCVKCVCRTFMITDSSCPVCRVAVDGTTGSVTIVYQEV